MEINDNMRVHAANCAIAMATTIDVLGLANHILGDEEDMGVAVMRDFYTRSIQNLISIADPDVLQHGGQAMKMTMEVIVDGLRDEYKK